MPWLAKVVATISKGFCKMTKVEFAILNSLNESDIDGSDRWVGSMGLVRSPRIAKLTR